MRRELLSKVTSGGRLDRDEALEAGLDLAQGRSEPLVTAAFLGALAARGESVEELAGLAEAFRRSVRPFPLHPEAVDTCGTGGDGQGTHNLSTAAALVAASLGVTVAKHGNRSVSSACGSADVLSALGYPVEEPPEDAHARLLRRGFAFLFAPLYHPAMAHVAPVRRAMGVRTIFNLLGPLLNPAGVTRQVVGVFDAGRLGLVADSLGALGVERALVVHGAGGYDEAVLHGKVLVVERRGDRSFAYAVGPSAFGLPGGSEGDLRGGSPEENAGALSDLLNGRGPSGLRAAVAANTALVLRAAGACEDLREAAGRSMEAMGTGRAGRFFRSMLDDGGEARDARAS